VNGTVWIRASRRVEAGEELTYDYHTNGDAKLPCQCRPHCKGSL
jgi:SET domain-containing protein